MHGKNSQVQEIFRYFPRCRKFSCTSFGKCRKISCTLQGAGKFLALSKASARNFPALSYIGAGNFQGAGNFPALSKVQEIFLHFLSSAYISIKCFPHAISSQIFIGPSRSSVIENRDMVKELRAGMLIAIATDNFPKVGEVTAIPPNVSLDSSITVKWMVQERASHKPKWQRSFKVGGKHEETKLENVLLYGFQLTGSGCFKKKSREYLKKTLNI